MNVQAVIIAIQHIGRDLSALTRSRPSSPMLIQYVLQTLRSRAISGSSRRTASPLDLLFCSLDDSQISYVRLRFNIRSTEDMMYSLVTSGFS